MNLLIRKTLDRSKPNRRDFMVQSTCAGLGISTAVNTLAQLKLTGAAAAASAPTDYKALVCVFLNGGNDSNNLLVPMGSTPARTAYAAGRGVLAISDADITAAGSNLSPANPGAYDPSAGYTNNQLGLHPGAAPLAGLFNQGKLAVLANVGTLSQPGLTRATFNTVPANYKPPQLFSHSDQQTQWQSSIPDRPFTSGWGGRVADLLGPYNAGDLSISVSINGLNSFQVGLQEQPYILGTNGVSDFDGFGPSNVGYSDGLRNTALSPDFKNVGGATKYNPMAAIGTGTDPLAATNYKNQAQGWRLRALEQVLAMSHASLFDTTYIGVPKNARFTEGIVGNALTTANAITSPATIDSYFNTWFPANNPYTSIPDIGNQFKTVAKLIAGRSQLSNNRQIFFVQLGGWDTHTSQIPSTSPTAGQYNLYNQLSRAMRAFYDTMVGLGIENNVTCFTASDFNRTLTPNKNDSTGGSDHAWGGHALVMGGAVNGGTATNGSIYGTFPTLTINGGIDCTGNRGRWIPSTSVDSYAARLALWFGVDKGDLPVIFPNLARFENYTSGAWTKANGNLGFI